MIPARPLLTLRAQATPDAPALVAEGESLTWSELARRVAGRATALRESGVRAGDVVALLLENGAAFIECVHAIEAVGATLLPLNLRWTASELAQPLADAKPRLLIHGRGELERRATAAARTTGTPCSFGRRSFARSDSAPAGEHPFAILYTSGTSGPPKGAVLSRDAVVWSALAAGLHLGTSPHDCWLACMPLQHVGGLSIVLRSVLSGGCVVVHERFDPGRVARTLRDERITQVSFVARMLEQVLAVDPRTPESLRCVLVGGGPVPEALVARALAAGWPIAPTYGLTEAASQVATRPPWVPPDQGLAPLFGTQVEIVDEAGRTLPPGAEGEIRVSTPALMSAYWNDAAATARALRDGWLHTGDIGRLDARGGLHVLARRSDLVVSGGENVYPAEVEVVLEAHPDVAEAGVAGREDASFGARPVAWLVLRRGARLDPDTLAAHCRERLAGYKLPVAYHAVAALPRDGAGKLVRRRLGES